MAAWVTEHVIPHERAVRAWLARHASQEDVDELIQESYSRLAALDSVDHIDRADDYFFSIARNLLVRRLRRARLVPIEAIAAIDAFQDDIRTPPERKGGGSHDYLRLIEPTDALPERPRARWRTATPQDFSPRANPPK